MNKPLFTAGVTKVRIIPATATNNVPRDMVILVLDGKSQPIIRTFKQFVLDLQESHLIPRTVNDINHPDVLDVVRDVQGGSVSGEVEFWKKGSEYTVDDNSTVVTNPEHPDYGNYKPGDKHKRISDGSRVEGFLTLKRATAAEMASRTAKQTAQLVAQMIGIAQQPVVMETTPADDVDLTETEFGDEPKTEDNADEGKSTKTTGKSNKKTETAEAK